MKKSVTAILAVIAVALTGFSLWSSIAMGSAASARAAVTIIAGANPGGGWDTTARSVQQVMREHNIVGNAQVVNIPGAGGTIAMTKLEEMEGNEQTLMITGGGMIASSEIAQPGVQISDVTPIAKFTEEYSVVVVPTDSPFQTMEEYVSAWQNDPDSIAVGGASIGNTDHLLASRVALDVGLKSDEMKYIPFEGGGDLLNALLSNSVDVGYTGYKEVQDQVENGSLRVLGVSADERQPGIEDVPTFKEAGVNVVASNWRGFAAPPGISEEEKQELVDIIEEVHDVPEWKDIMARNGWNDALVTGEEADEFFAQEHKDAIDIVEVLGL
ncbi:Bug family tripartite tricarboxylate transporter substrate binding protein [Corynebacterium camporealensis]